MYHPQLSYCMVLYVSKDHTLTREVPMCTLTLVARDWRTLALLLLCR
jgi:hypothetical protein